MTSTLQQHNTDLDAQLLEIEEGEKDSRGNQKIVIQEQRPDMENRHTEERK